MAKNHALFDAITKAGKPETAPAPTETPADLGYYKAPSREGKLHVSAWLSPDYKVSLRAIQMKFPNRSLQDLFSEALNDMFEKYDVPVVSGAKNRPTLTPKVRTARRAHG